MSSNKLYIINFTKESCKKIGWSMTRSSIKEEIDEKSNGLANHQFVKNQEEE